MIMLQFHYENLHSQSLETNVSSSH